MYSFAAFIMQGRMQQVLVAVCVALLSLVKLPLSSPLSYLSAATVALVTLHRGAKEGALLVAVITITTSLVAIPLFSNASIAFVFLLVFWLPVWALAAILRATMLWGTTLQAVGVMALTFVVFVFVAVPDLPQQWYAWLAPNAQIIKDAGLFESEQHQEQILRSVANLMTGFVAASVMLGVVASLILGRWMQAILYNPGGFQQEFHQLALGRRFTFGVVVLLAAAMLLKTPVLIAAAIVAYVLFALQGLAVIHAVVTKRKLHVAWLVALYGAMIVAFPQFVALVSMLGMMDNGLDFRSRVGAKRIDND